MVEINDVDLFFELDDEWNRVLERSSDNHVMLTWEFMSTYVKHFGNERTLKVLCIKEGNRIIAIAPLRLSRYNLAGSFNYNVIEPLTYKHSDYTGLIIAEKEPKCLKLFLNYLVKQGGWDFIYLYDVPGTSMIPDLLPQISGSIPKFEVKEGAICPYLRIPYSQDALVTELDAKFRKNLRRSIKKLQNDYGKVELRRYDQLGSVENAMNIFFELHQKRWELKKKPGVFSTQKVRDFYLEIAKVFANKGWLALYFLMVNEEPVATQLCFEYKQKMLYGLGGFDPEFSKYSVGHIITAKMIEKCIEKKIREYDFMKGDEPYKFDWTKEYRRNVYIKFVNVGLKSKLYHFGIKVAKKTKIDKFLENYTKRTFLGKTI